MPAARATGRAAPCSCCRQSRQLCQPPHQPASPSAHHQSRRPGTRNTSKRYKRARHRSPPGPNVIALSQACTPRRNRSHARHEGALVYPAPPIRVVKAFPPRAPRVPPLHKVGRGRKPRDKRVCPPYYQSGFRARARPATHACKGHGSLRPRGRRSGRTHGDHDGDDDGDHHHHHTGAAAPGHGGVLRPPRGRRRGRRRALVAGGGGAASAGAVRGAAGLPAGQRVHPRALPLRVVRPRRAAQRLRMAQRDAQRLEPPGRLLTLPLPRRRQGDGEGRCRRRPRRPRHRDVRPDVGQRVLGDPHQLELGGEHGLLGGRAGEREHQPCRRRRGGAEVAADGVPGRRDDVPRRQRGGAPAGLPLPPLQPPLLAARLRRDRRHDRRLLLPAGLLRLPRRRRHAALLPVPDLPAGPPRGGAHALAGAVVAAAAGAPRRPVRVHGAVRGGAGAARAVDPLGPPRVPPGAGARARHGDRLRGGSRVLRQPGAGEVEAGEVRLRRTQPPDLPRARARRRAHALRRHGHPHQLAGGDGRRRRGVVVVTCGGGSHAAGAGQCICRQRVRH